MKLPNGRAFTGQSHDYKRHGTTTLFAALELATGKIIATPTGIYTLTNPSSGGYLELRSDANNCLSIANYFHTIQLYPVFDLFWI